MLQPFWTRPVPTPARDEELRQPRETRPWTLPSIHSEGWTQPTACADHAVCDDSIDEALPIAGDWFGVEIAGSAATSVGAARDSRVRHSRDQRVAQRESRRGRSVGRSCTDARFGGPGLAPQSMDHNSKALDDAAQALHSYLDGIVQLSEP